MPLKMFHYSPYTEQQYNWAMKSFRMTITAKSPPNTWKVMEAEILSCVWVPWPRGGPCGRACVLVVASVHLSERALLCRREPETPFSAIFKKVLLDQGLAYNLLISTWPVFFSASYVQMRPEFDHPIQFTSDVLSCFSVKSQNFAYWLKGTSTYFINVMCRTVWATLGEGVGWLKERVCDPHTSLLPSFWSGFLHRWVRK